MESARGQLLIAAPKLNDPNFFRTVILVLEHTEEGALGLVLNRPSDSMISDATPHLSQFDYAYNLILIGGPVAKTGVIALADFYNPDEAAMIAFGTVGVLSAETPEEGPAGGLRRVRAFAGHSGWGPGQLDAEIERGDWILEPAIYDDAFSDSPEDLWFEVLDRKGGSYALVARMPEHPELN